MSPQSSSSRGPYRKPRLDIYTWMLAFALIAMVTACICLYLEVADYGEQPYQLGRSAPLELDRPAALAECCGPRVFGERHLPARWKAPIHG